MIKLINLLNEIIVNKPIPRNKEPRFDIDNKIYPLSGNPDNLEELKQIIIKGVMNIIKYVADQFGTNIADNLYSLVEKVKTANNLDTLGKLYNNISDFLYINTDVYTSDYGVGKKSLEHPEYGG